MSGPWRSSASVHAVSRPPARSSPLVASVFDRVHYGCRNETHQSTVWRSPTWRAPARNERRCDDAGGRPYLRGTSVCGGHCGWRRSTTMDCPLIWRPIKLSKVAPNSSSDRRCLIVRRTDTRQATRHEAAAADVISVEVVTPVEIIPNHLDLRSGRNSAL